MHRALPGANVSLDGFTDARNKIGPIYVSMPEGRTSGRGGMNVQYTQYYLMMVVSEKIAEARREAAHDQLVLAASNARREARQATGSPFAGLLRVLASVFRKYDPRPIA